VTTLVELRGRTEILLTDDQGDTELLVVGTAGQTLLEINGGPPGSIAGAEVSLAFTIDGGGVDLTAGVKAGFDDLPFDGEILSWTLTADQPGEIVIDLWKAPFADYPPDSADSITGSEKPTLSGAQAERSSTLAGWTKTFAVGDSIIPNVDSVGAGITLARLTLRVKRL
jgi:hypothetical protein